MMISDKLFKSLISLIKELSIAAENIKKTDFDYNLKEDNSPLTEADTLLNKELTKFLLRTDITNIISEENKVTPYEIRKKWEYFWVLDPIDGTKEFINKGNDYTINVALCKHDKPIFGIVARPATGDIYFASKEKGVFKNKARLQQDKNQSKYIRIVASKSHINEDTKKIINSISNLADVEILNIGSSLKFCLLAENKADIYPRFGPTMEWDVCAANAILALGKQGLIYSEKQEKIVYNKKDLHNPNFIAFRNKDYLKYVF